MSRRGGRAHFARTIDVFKASTIPLRPRSAHGPECLVPGAPNPFVVHERVDQANERDLAGSQGIADGRLAAVHVPSVQAVYKGYKVGRVESTEFDPDIRKVRYVIFIDAPFHDLVDSEDPACQTGTCDLGAAGDSCGSASECCSAKCKGRPGSKTCR